MAMRCKRNQPAPGQSAPPVAAIILAGGRSSRMGRDKAGLSLGGRTLLARIRETAREVSTVVRVVRRDRFPGCGPLGGVHTALHLSPAPLLLFLSCDMPWVSAAWLRRLVLTSAKTRRAVFTESDGLLGFPFALHATSLGVVEAQMHSGPHSLQALAATLGARRMRAPRSEELANLNTPAELKAAREKIRRPTGRVPQSSKPRTRRKPAR